MTDREKYEKFLDALKQNGDMYFSLGSLKRDVANIEGIISYQGYWAGAGLRYFFDKDFNLISTEERRFGR